MKSKTKLIVIGGVFALNLVAFALPQPVLQSQKAVQAKIVKGVQKATILIDSGRYAPSVIQVSKGKPVELTFKLGENPGCGRVLVIKNLKLKKTIQTGKSEIVKFTPAKAGTMAVTCGMGMFDGKIIVK